MVRVLQETEWFACCRMGKKWIGKYTDRMHQEVSRSPLLHWLCCCTACPCPPEVATE